MRTTLRIDDDVLHAVRDRAQREGRSIGDVLSDLAREALLTEGATQDETDELHGFLPLPRRGAAVSNELIDQLREDDPV